MAPPSMVSDPRDQDLNDTPHSKDEAHLSSSEIEARADAILGVVHDPDAEPDSLEVAPNEIELVCTGLLRNQRGAQASAAHWEAKRLSDEDLEQLGYGPDSEETT